tara:strand:- start:2333 stop:2755 length:423 start_codon:yes stop_codon:yes gene_type:complete
MYELVYSSIARTNLDMADVKNILETSRAINSKNKITGCLLYHKGQFTQILEGNEKIIKETYSRIEQDNRHFNVKLLYTGEKNERIFDHWNMAFMEVGNKVGDFPETFFEKNLLTFAEFTEKPTRAVKLFWEKVRQIIKEI